LQISKACYRRTGYVAFDALAQDLLAILRLAAGRAEEPTVAIIDSRTLRSTPESGSRGFLQRSPGS
jgi:hypothetical protein